MNLSTKIGALIAKYRKNAKLTQERLAELTDMHPDYIGKIERGERMPSVESLLTLIKCLGIKNEVFFRELE